MSVDELVQAKLYRLEELKKSLVRSLEEENIGRPSTYATIVSTITKRDYVEREGRSLKPTDLGMLVTKLLVAHFRDVFNLEFTAGMEEELDDIEDGKREWQHVVRDLWTPLSKDLESGKKKAGEIKKSLQEKTDITCPACGQHQLVKKFGRNGAFLASPGYPECKHTQPLDQAELPVPVEGKCELCGAGLVARQGPYGRYTTSSRPTATSRRRSTAFSRKCSIRSLPCYFTTWAKANSRMSPRQWAGVQPGGRCTRRGLRGYRQGWRSGLPDHHQ